ncbi:MAG TPA: M20 family metallopeptidase [Acidimicrobiales bacterium]|nr:M20 family metallopeptidase [Acidimicrobiales bacterium]
MQDMATPQVDSALLVDAQRELDRAVVLRRRLHVHPELGLELPRTQQAVLDALDGLGLDISVGTATSSVTAVLEGARPGPTTLLRGDMDALPMPEDTGLPFASEVDGVMHACGHDAHVAMLAGAARMLAARRHTVAGRVVFMFQPGEEGFAGARHMLDEGLLDRTGPVDRAFAIHITPIFPSGMVATRAGTLMASADEFIATVTGRGGHASMPHDAIDPVPVACEIVTALQSMATRRLPAFDPAVVTVASIRAGTTSNVIPERAVLEGTVRAVSESSRALALDGVRRVVEHVAAAHLCSAEVSARLEGYPVTVNNDAVAERALQVAGALIGPEHTLRMPTPVMGAEDWSFVLQRVPGAMAFLGAAPVGIDRPAPNHSNRMLIDESAMATGMALYAAMALD